MMFAAIGIMAQTYPATLNVPVTFFDYHSNGSNPDFNPGHSGDWYISGRHYNMLADTLDANGLPTIGTSVNLNWGINKWFQSWTPGDFRKPVYYRLADAPNPIGALKSVTANSGTDTNYKNITIQDNLVFTYVPNSPGLYTFNDDAFFRLDNRGFGNEPTWVYNYGTGSTAVVNDHNYSFAMHMHWPFTYTPGQKFNFKGDDDVWVFLNHKMALDIGGIHEAVSDSFVLDDAFVTANGLNMVAGGQYDFDMFYCERQSTASHIQITSNIVTAKPDTIKMTVHPDTNVVPAGTVIKYIAHVEKTGGLFCDQCSKNVKWNLSPNTTRSYLTPASPTRGDTGTFYAIDAYQKYIITATYDSIIQQTGYYDTVHIKFVDTVMVVPGPATHLNIEQNSDSMVSLRSDNRLGALTISNTVLTQNVYGILRDAYGNWVSHATNDSWLSRDTTVVTATATGQTQLGEGQIKRISAVDANTVVRASKGAFFDTLQVHVSTVTYSQIQIYVLDGGIKPIDSLVMRSDQDSTLFARGLRADGSGIWDPLSVTWTYSSGLKFDNNPGQGKSWTVSPIDTTARGYIYIADTSNSIVLRDSVKVRFLPGLPNTEVLYPLAGKPNTTVPANPPFAANAFINVVAGDSFQIVAKLFDKNNLWLSSYERADAPITWSMQELTGNANTATLTPANNLGYLTKFVGTKAGTVVKVTASYQENGLTVTPQSLTLVIIPGPPTHLVVESDSIKSRSPNADQPLQTVTIGGRDTLATVYAILRDKFGNWVDFSKITTWSSADVTQATVLSGNASVGQGLISRVAKSGQTIITAKDVSGFSGTVTVNLSSITYDSLRIVVGPNNDLISSLNMRTDVGDTTLNVQGKRSDNGQWEFVPANWAINPALRTSTVPSQTSSWKFTPIDTGSGIIVASRQGTSGIIADTVKIHFMPGLAYSLALYQAPGTPGGANQAFQSPGTVLIDTAGKPLPIYAKVFDRNGIWLGSYERASAPIDWNIVEISGNPPTGTISSAVGNTTTLNPVRAYNTVYIIARLDSTGLPTTARDTIQVRIVAGAPSKLVIEADPNWQVKPNTATPVDSVKIANTQRWVPVYALLRDKLDNFVQYSTNTTWGSLNDAGAFDTSIVNVSSGTNTIGEGIVRRIASEGSQRIYAKSNDYPGLGDTAVAVVLKYYYIQLMIVVGNSNISIDKLYMTTNDDTTLKVIGLRSDTAAWEPVNAKWEISTGIYVPSNEAPPGSANKWSFSPSAPGTGWIRVTLGNDAQTLPDTVQAVFAAGPPTGVTIDIITPPAQRIAGDTIVAVVKVTNKDGLIPDTCYATSYQNALGGGGGRPDPVVIADQVEKMGQTASECFKGGVDTVKFVLYKAPYNKDSLEKITVTLNSLVGVTDPFNVLPGDLNKIVIEDAGGKALDTVKLQYPNDNKSMYAVGYDKYGNKIGRIGTSTWDKDGNLHPIDFGNNVASIYYKSGDAIKNEAGNIIVSATNAAGTKVADSVYVIISKPISISTSTWDADGNGYLDKIELHLGDLATIPVTGSTITFSGTYDDKVTGKTVQYSNLVADSIVSKNGTTTDSVFTLYLKEPLAGTPASQYPQTGWTPTISIGGLPGGVSFTSVAADSAGPVIWSVTKTINSTTDRSKDVITVTLSEPIKNGNQDFSLSTLPKNVFYVWTTGGDTSSASNFVKVQNLFDSILTFTSIDPTKTVVTFNSVPGVDFTSRDYLSLNDSAAVVSDGKSSGNTPAPNNRKVKIIVNGLPIGEILVAPNPTGPIFTHESPGVFNLAYQPKAREWVRTDHAGALLTFKIALSVDPKTGEPEKITGYLKVYDMIGNVVLSAKGNSNGIIPSTWGKDASTYDFDMYWNGSNEKKMPVAPGIYRVMLFLTYPNSSVPKKYIATVGISK